jgi:hypothetical protein
MARLTSRGPCCAGCPTAGGAGFIFIFGVEGVTSEHNEQNRPDNRLSTCNAHLWGAER